MYSEKNVMIYGKKSAYKSKEKKGKMQLEDCKPSPIICKPFIIQSHCNDSNQCSQFGEFLLDSNAKTGTETNASLSPHYQIGFLNFKLFHL